MDSAHIALVLRVQTASPGPTPEMFRIFFCSGNFFKSGTGHETRTLSSLDGSDCLGRVTPFTLQEFGAVLRDLHYGRAADANGMVAVVFKMRQHSFANMFVGYLQFDDCKWVFQNVVGF